MDRLEAYEVFFDYVLPSLDENSRMQDKEPILSRIEGLADRREQTTIVQLRDIISDIKRGTYR